MGLPCLLKHTKTKSCNHTYLGMFRFYDLLTSMVDFYQQRYGLHPLPDRRLELDSDDVTDMCLVCSQPEMDGYQ